MTRIARRLTPRKPAHLVNAGLSFVGLVACTVIGGELLSDVVHDEENFPQVPGWAKAPAIVVFMLFAAIEANKVRNRLTKARGFK